MNSAPQWEEVRCQSPTCDRAERGGRVLFTRRGDLCVKAGHSGSLIAERPIGAICRCGALWRSPDLDTTATEARILECMR